MLESGQSSLTLQVVNKGIHTGLDASTSEGNTIIKYRYVIVDLYDHDLIVFMLISKVVLLDFSMEDLYSLSHNGLILWWTLTKD